MTTSLARDLGPIAFLGADDEIELARRRDAGDLLAARELVARNVPLALTMAAGYARRHPRHRDDLASAAMVGLATAAGRFDPAFGVRFTTYAGHWVRNAIQLYIEVEMPMVRVPRHIHTNLSRDRRGLSLFRASAHTPGQFRAAAVALAAQAVGTDPRDPGPGPLDYLPDRPEAEAVESEDADRLAVALDALPPRMASVVRLRFGLGGGEPATLQEVGRELGCSKERARQIERQGLDQLRALMGEDGR